MQYKHVKDWQKIPELACLKKVSSPPKSLFIQGNFDPKIFNNCVAVVGSRRMTNYGRQVIEKLVPQLVFQGKTVVSGFMYGVDQYAHQVCIDSGGKTIAVLGWGITTQLQDYDKKLASDIINSGGILLSEWQDQPSTLWTFPARNRIVAGLSSDIYVIEAAEKSGSLLTADLASRFSKKIWAIPGPITSKTSVGTNLLIKQGKADMWLGEQPELHQQTDDPILKLLASEPLTTNDIAKKLNQPVAQIGAALTMLGITNQIIEREGKFYLNYVG
jgi:DNA processing protein